MGAFGTKEDSLKQITMKEDKKQLPDVSNPGFQILTDESLMPYGTHVGKKMIDVPAEYLLWLSDNDKCSKSVRAYITDNWDVLHKQSNRNPKRGMPNTRELPVKRNYRRH